MIRITGSDTMVNLLQAWAEQYGRVRPEVVVQVAGGGSGVGLAGLIDATLDIAAASREIRPAERERARRVHGNYPEELTVALDALAVYVHKANPVETIGLTQLAEIYGEHGQIARWSQLGVTHRGCAADLILRVGRQNNSGTFAYFRDVVLGRHREYKMGSIDQSGSKDVVALVSRTPCAIGYSGMAYATADVKPLRISTRPDLAAVAPTSAAVVDGTYPLARPLYLYAVPKGEWHVRAFLDWVRSRQASESSSSWGSYHRRSPR